MFGELSNITNRIKVLEVHENGKDCYSAIIAGIGKTRYDALIDVDHPKECTCTYPFAKEIDVICKYMVRVGSISS